MRKGKFNEMAVMMVIIMATMAGALLWEVYQIVVVEWEIIPVTVWKGIVVFGFVAGAIRTILNIRNRIKEAPEQ